MKLAGHVISLCMCCQSVENTLGAASYQNNKVNQWTSSVVEQCLNQLTKLGKPFKYIGELGYSLIVPHTEGLRRRERGGYDCVRTFTSQRISIFLLILFSKLSNNAEDRCWTAHSELVLLGQLHRWSVYRVTNLLAPWDTSVLNSEVFWPKKCVNMWCRLRSPE